MWKTRRENIESLKQKERENEKNSNCYDLIFVHWKHVLNFHTVTMKGYIIKNKIRKNINMSKPTEKLKKKLFVKMVYFQ